MPVPATLLVFALAAGVLVAIPGPNHIYIALFFLAFLPQFVDPRRGATSAQILVLGLVVFVIATTSDVVYALAAGALGGWLRGRPSFVRRQRYVTGSIYLGLPPWQLSPAVSVAAPAER